MSELKRPARLRARGKSLWDSITEQHQLDVWQVELLTEACRIADRLETLDRLLTGDTKTWASLVHGHDGVTLEMSDALKESRQQQNVLKQLLVSLRLPDAVTGERPQRRSARGSYAKGAASRVAQVSSLERARLAKQGA